MTGLTKIIPRSKAKKWHRWHYLLAANIVYIKVGLTFKKVNGVLTNMI